MPNRSTLLSFEIRNIREYEDSTCSFSFLNSQKVYDDVDSDSSVARLCGNVYDSKIVALCGINASGKTTLLSMIRFMLSVYLSNRPLDSFHSLLQRLYGSQDIEISAIFAVGGAVYKIDSAISKDDRDSFSFRNETLYELKGKISRQAISDEAMYKIVQTRNTLPEDAKLFLDKGKSIASMVQDKNDNLSMASRRMLRITTLASSPCLEIPLLSSLRRSSVRGGNTRRITEPSSVGLMPTSEAWIALLMSLRIISTRQSL